MAKASDNQFPYVHLVPAVAPANPAAGERLYLDSGDGNKLKRRSTAGVVTTVEGGSTVESWTTLTLASGFVSNANRWGGVPEYRKFGDIVQLRGTIRNTDTTNLTTASAITVATLPSGYRPSVSRYAGFVGSSWSNQWEVQSTGDVKFYIYQGTTSWVALDGVSFSIA